MSGGHYNYAYSRIEDLAREIKPSSPLRKAFKKHLIKVAEACWEIERQDSGDGANEEPAIREALGENWPRLVLSEAIAAATEAKQELEEAIKAAKSIATNASTRKP